VFDLVSASRGRSAGLWPARAGRAR
jgi:hypothetical protein